MVTIGMNYEVIEGKEETFENAFYNVVTAMRRIAGHSDSQMYRDVRNPRRYLIISQWNDKTAFDAFIASDTFRNVVNWGKEEILIGRPRHQVYGG